MSFYNNTEDLIKSKGFEIISKDFERPWGGFLVIEESQAQDFSNQFFKGINVDSLKISEKLSPKILIVKPNARLSWQYHHINNLIFPIKLVMFQLVVTIGSIHGGLRSNIIP